MQIINKQLVIFTSTAHRIKNPLQRTSEHNFQFLPENICFYQFQTFSRIKTGFSLIDLKVFPIIGIYKIIELRKYLDKNQKKILKMFIYYINNDFFRYIFFHLTYSLLNNQIFPMKPTESKISLPVESYDEKTAKNE